MNTDYKFFLRISKEEYIDRLLNEGQIYCNNLTTIREMDEADFRGDRYDSIHSIHDYQKAEISIVGKKFVSNKGTLTLPYSGNIYCLYGIKAEMFDLKPNSKQKVDISAQFIEMDEWAILITDPNEFYKKIVNQLDLQNAKYKFHKVEYFEGDFPKNKIMGAFDKRQKFSFQNEIRLYIENNSDKHVEFFIGNISNIAMKIKREDLKNLEVEFLL